MANAIELSTLLQHFNAVTGTTKVVKFNRRGAAALRTITLLGAALTWMTPAEHLAYIKTATARSKGDLDLAKLVPDCSV